MTDKIPLPPSFETAYTVAKVGMMRQFKDDNFFDYSDAREFLTGYFKWDDYENIDITIDGFLETMEDRGFLYANPHVDMYEMNEKVPDTQTFYMIFWRPVASEFGTYFTPAYENGRVEMSSNKAILITRAGALARQNPDKEYDIFKCESRNK